jgi:prepilin-type processing-associated H-X9-DG protein
MGVRDNRRPTAMGERVIINITFADGHGTPDRVIGPML